MTKNKPVKQTVLAAAVKQAARTQPILRDRIAEGGRCFNLALNCAMILSDELGCECRVVHAILGNGLVHAWTEVDGLFCVDLTLIPEHPQLVTSTKAEYYARACPSVSRSYRTLEAVTLTGEHEDTPGPWHSPFTDQLAVNHASAARVCEATSPERSQAKD